MQLAEQARDHDIHEPEHRFDERAGKKVIASATISIDDIRRHDYSDDNIRQL